MHQLLPLKFKVLIIVVLTAFIGHAASAFGFRQLALGTVISVAELGIIFLALRTWGWISWVPGLPAWMKVNLNGEWEGLIESQWCKSPSPTVTSLSIPVFARIYQNWLHIVINIETDAMRSNSLPAAPSFDPITKQLFLRYFFETEPNTKSSLRNPPQKLGGAIARIDANRPDEITIMYTNERGPGGEIKLRKIAQSRQRDRVKRKLEHIKV